VLIGRERPGIPIQNLSLYCLLPTDTTGRSRPINTVIFYNSLPDSEESFKRFYAAFVMDRILENFIMYFMCVMPWRWSQEWPKHVSATSNKTYTAQQLHKRAFVGLCVNDKFTLTRSMEHTKFVTAFTRACHLPLSWTRSIQATLFQKICLIFVLVFFIHLCLDFSSGPFVQDYSAAPYVHLFSSPCVLYVWSSVRSLDRAMGKLTKFFCMQRSLRYASVMNFALP
jgi:hypothetical protein